MNVKLRFAALALAVLTLLPALAACESGEPIATGSGTQTTAKTSGTTATVPATTGDTTSGTTAAASTQSGTTSVSFVPPKTIFPPSSTAATSAASLTTAGSSASETTVPTETAASSVTTQATVIDPSGLRLSVPVPSFDTSGLTDEQLNGYFSDAVFVGDSISLGWRNYVIKKRNTDAGFFSDAQFFVSGSYGAANALADVSSASVHPRYQGEQMQPWVALPKMNAKKVFILFGLNDVALYGVNKTISNFDVLTGYIRTAIPDAQICIISATYVVKGGEKGSLNSTNLRALDMALIDFCAEKGFDFLNLADALADTDGNLASKYCSDGYVHHSEAGYIIWTKVLKGYAASKLR